MSSGTVAELVAELESNLSAMAMAKPPGVSGSKINAVTSLCVTNIQSESVLIQKIYTHFKKTPGTHKLGVLYALDAVTRKWLDLAKGQGQVVDISAQDGTFAAGVNRVKALMPGLMNDLVSSSPHEQKEKIRKLVDIWDRTQLFEPPMIEAFRQKLANGPLKVDSSTPPGSPPRNKGLPGVPPSLALPSSTQNGSDDIMKALAKINNISPSHPPAPPMAQALQLVSAGAAPPVPAAAPTPSQAPTSLTDILSKLKATGEPGQPAQGFQQAHQLAHPPIPAAAPQPMNTQPQVPQATYYPTTTALQPGPYTTQPHYTQAPPMRQLPAPAFAAAPAAAIGAQHAMDPAMQQQILVVKALVEQGVPPEAIPAILASLPGATGAAPPAATPPQTQPPQLYGGVYPTYSHDSGDHNSMRSPPLRSRGRSRSRSPGREWATHESPRTRNDGRFDSPGPRRYGDDRRGGASEYRQRSPAGRRRSPSPHGRTVGFEIPRSGDVPKFIDYDPEMEPGHIRVLSRTLFVGGVSCSDSELKDIFGRHGWVQSCIVNTDKRHAFVKMMTRQDAMAVKTAMEKEGQGGGSESGKHHKNGGHNGILDYGSDLPFRQCRWGVGYGPRDCSNYTTGISVIPIARLTDADKRWMLSASYGGSGGKEIVSGLVVEEPDIEIGAGVSSKAISRRMQGGDEGGQGQGHGQRGGGKHHKGGRGFKDRRGGGASSGEDRAGWSHGRSGSGSGGAVAGGSDQDFDNPNNMPIGDRARKSGGGSSAHHQHHRRGSNSGGGHGHGHHQYQSHGHEGHQNQKAQTGAGAGANIIPEVEALPFGLTVGSNGMPQFPPGFTFPDPGR